MALRLPVFSLKALPKPQVSRKCPSLSFPQTLLIPAHRRRIRGHARARPVSGGDGEMNLEAEVAGLVREKAEEREEAMRRCRGVLFGGLSRHHGMGTEEARGRWVGMEGRREEKVEWVVGFVEEELGLGFEPLSVRAVVEMVDEHVAEMRVRDRTEAEAEETIHRPRRSCEGIGDDEFEKFMSDESCHL